MISVKTALSCMGAKANPFPEFRLTRFRLSEINCIMWHTCLNFTARGSHACMLKTINIKMTQYGGLTVWRERKEADRFLEVAV